MTVITQNNLNLLDVRFEYNVRLTEQLADIEFSKAIHVYEMENNIELVLKRIEIDCKSADFSKQEGPAFVIKNMLL